MPSVMRNKPLPVGCGALSDQPKIEQNVPFCPEILAIVSEACLWRLHTALHWPPGGYEQQDWPGATRGLRFL